MFKHRTCVFMTVMVALAILAGCSDDDPPTTPEPPLRPSSPDEAIDEFVVTYSEERFEEFGEVLSEDFRLILKNNEGEIDDTEMMAITELMMTGQMGPGGLAVEDISVVSMTPAADWAETPPEDLQFGAFEGSLYRPYDVGFDFAIAGQSLTYQVRGLVVFYVMSEGTVDEPVYRIIGCTDNTSGSKAVENSSWSSILTLFN